MNHTVPFWAFRLSLIDHIKRFLDLFNFYSDLKVLLRFSLKRLQVVAQLQPEVQKPETIQPELYPSSDRRSGKWEFSFFQGP